MVFLVIFYLFKFLVYSSYLEPLSDLQILEIRSSGSYRNLIFHIDQPIPTIEHANFESVNLIADEKIKNLIKYPSEQHDSIPIGELYTYNNDESQDTEEYQIVPYDVYKVELTKSMRPSFFGWNNLAVLRIHNCFMDELEYEMFAGMENLQHLSMEHDGIKVIPPFAFYGARYLKTLSLAQNEILDMNFLDLAGLLKLEHLDLSSNHLTKLSEESFPPFTSLKKFDLRGNPIEHIFPMTFAILNTTKEISLGSESTVLHLADTHDAFKSLNELKSLNLLNVKSPSINQTIFTGLKSVERLKIRGFIERIELDAFVEMPELKELILSSCDISDISMDAFYGAKNLRIIDLSSNKLTRIPLGLFDDHQKLQEIYLQKNMLKKLPEDFFLMESVKLIRLTDNPWKCSCEMSKWKQSVTNSIRLNKLSSNDKNCIRNPKTGKIDYCDDEFDDFPKYSYGFDNKMSPLCTDVSKNKLKDVYFFVRHNFKCSHPTNKLEDQKVDKNRLMNKIPTTYDEPNYDKRKKSNPWKQSMSQITRENQNDFKVKRISSSNAEIIDEQVLSNDVLGS